MDEEIKIEGNLDINQALKEFEEKSVNENIPKTVEKTKVSDIPKIVQLFMKWFKAERREAEYGLLGVSVLFIVISLFLIFRLNMSRGINLEQEKLFPPGSPALR